ncbi:MAG: hypothetical protein Aurels2KO_39260 [Aureliella sp.]
MAEFGNSLEDNRKSDSGSIPYLVDFLIADSLSILDGIESGTLKIGGTSRLFANMREAVDLLDKAGDCQHAKSLVDIARQASQYGLTLDNPSRSLARL